MENVLPVLRTEVLQNYSLYAKERSYIMQQQTFV